MATNLNINPKLLIEAKKIGKHKTKRETVDAALAEYIQRRRQLGILALMGKIEYFDDYNYKAQRKRR